MFSYLQAGWWVRSHAPLRSFPSWCRCVSCTASTGQSGLPRRSHWLSPPAGLALPSGPLPPLWTCKPYPPAARRWQSLSLCACAWFQVVRFLLSEYSSPDIMKERSKLDVVQCEHTGLCPKGFFPLQQASQRVSILFLSPPKTSVFSPPVANLCLWFEGKGARLLCPSFKSPFSYSLQVAVQLWGSKFRCTAVEVDQESWWPNQLPWWEMGVGAAASGARCFGGGGGGSKAINVTSESSCQAICLSSYSASGWRCVTCHNKWTHVNSFLSSIFSHQEFTSKLLKWTFQHCENRFPYF